MARLALWLTRQWRPVSKSAISKNKKENNNQVIIEELKSILKICHLEELSSLHIRSTVRNSLKLYATSRKSNRNVGRAVMAGLE